MILRRLFHQLLHQHWTAVFLDFVTVVLGVFIGLQVQDWNDARTARAELDQQLTGFRQELETALAHFADYRAELVRQMEDVTALREAFKSEPPAISSEAFDSKFLNAQRIKVFAPDLTALNELAETGGLRRLKDAGLRHAIGDWQRELGNVNRNYADGLRQRDSVMNPFMMNNIAYGPLLEQSYIVGEDIGNVDLPQRHRGGATGQRTAPPVPGVHRLRPPPRRVVDRQLWGRHADVSWSRARTGGKSEPRYNILNKLAPVVFVATGGEQCDQSAGSTGSAPVSFSSRTTNFAGFVSLAFRPTVCTSSGPS